MRWDLVDFMILIISFSHHFPTLLDLVDLEEFSVVRSVSLTSAGNN